MVFLGVNLKRLKLTPPSNPPRPPLLRGRFGIEIGSNQKIDVELMFNWEQKNNKQKTHKHFSDGPCGTIVPGTNPHPSQGQTGQNSDFTVELNRERLVCPRDGSHFVPGRGPICPGDSSCFSRRPSRRKCLCLINFISTLFLHSMDMAKSWRRAFPWFSDGKFPLSFEPWRSRPLKLRVLKDLKAHSWSLKSHSRGLKGVYLKEIRSVPEKSELIETPICKNRMFTFNNVFFFVSDLGLHQGNARKFLALNLPRISKNQGEGRTGIGNEIATKSIPKEPNSPIFLSLVFCFSFF